MRKGYRTLLVAVVLAACSTSTTEPEGRSDSVVGATVEMTLRLGEERTVDGTVLRLAFVRVKEDSRCPADVTCVWEGNAAVELGVAMGTGPTHPLTLNTALEPRATDWNGVRLTLLEVSPYPGTEAEGDPYRVRVRVEDAAR